MQAFVIYLEEVPYTLDAAKLAAESAAQNGLSVQLFPGYTPSKGQAILNTMGINMYDPGEKIYRIKGTKPGVIGCFVSHLMLWHHIAHQQEPIIIMEHDARIVRPIPDVEFKDILHLDDYRFTKDLHEGEHDQVVKHIEVKKGHNTMRGAYAYVVTPEAAQKLIDLAKNQGYTAADMHISSRAGIELNAIWPRCAIVSDPKSLTSDRNFNL